MLAAESREGKSYLAVHFPLHPSLAMLITFLPQLCIPILIGLSISCWPGKSGATLSPTSAIDMVGAGYCRHIHDEFHYHDGGFSLERYTCRRYMGDVFGNILNG